MLDLGTDTGVAISLPPARRFSLRVTAALHNKPMPTHIPMDSKAAWRL